jgi:hypothetical protein
MSINKSEELRGLRAAGKVAVLFWFVAVRILENTRPALPAPAL